MKDLISVIVSVCNKIEFLRESLDSILNQTYKNLEILIVDDGSFDGTATLCDEYAKRDERIKVIHEPLMSMVAVKNIGLKSANGKYITFVNGGDYVDEYYVERLYLGLIEHDTDIAFCRYKKYFTSHNEKIYEENLQNTRNYILNFDEFVSNVFISEDKDNNIKCRTWRSLFKAEVIKKNDLSFDESVVLWEDIKFLFTYLKCSNSYYVVNEYLYYLRQKENENTQYNDNLIEIKLDAFNQIINYVKDENAKCVIRFNLIDSLFNNELSSISTYYDNEKVKRIYKLPEYKYFTIKRQIKSNSSFNFITFCLIKLKMPKLVWKLNRNKQ